MSAKKIRLELSMESHPHQILEVGAVAAVPAIGDYVAREGGGWVGYVQNRRWTIRADGTGIDVRCWLHKDPPR